MKKLISVLLGTLLFASSMSFAEARSTRTKSTDVYVNGYHRSNGTYVKPYYRTPKNSTKLDNYSCLDYGRCK
ncbi:MAG: hypothetical protein ACOYN2_04015 [Patescibacteria group bacterium]